MKEASHDFDTVRPNDVAEDESEQGDFNITEAFSQEGLTTEDFNPEDQSHMAKVLCVVSKATLKRCHYKIIIGPLINLLGNKITSSQITSFASDQGKEILLTPEERSELSDLLLIAREQRYDNIENLRTADEIVKKILRRIDTLLAQSCQFEERAAYRKDYRSIPGLMHAYGHNFEPVDLSLEGDEIPQEIVIAVRDRDALKRRVLFLQSQNRKLQDNAVGIGKRIEETVKSIENLLRASKNE
ncbi:MAG TPA: hypothetical protein VI913_03230 [Candidatus Peribacteraceae bacterium]|nr:hypothetical protein [Candidatus Peribacteraceae bacterium]